QGDQGPVVRWRPARPPSLVAHLDHATVDLDDRWFPRYPLHLDAAGAVARPDHHLAAPHLHMRFPHAVEHRAQAIVDRPHRHGGYDISRAANVKLYRVLILG